MIFWTGFQALDFARGKFALLFNCSEYIPLLFSGLQNLSSSCNPQPAEPSCLLLSNQQLTIVKTLFSGIYFRGLSGAGNA